MKIPVPDELTLKQIAEWWAVESEPTEEKILDRFSSAFWRGAFEDDLENSCLCLIQPITTDRHGVAMTGSWRFVDDEDRWERQESKIDPAPPTKIWNRRRALYVIRPIRKLTLPPTPELWPADGKPKSLNEIVESTLWETLAGLGLNWFNLNFRNCMKAATVSRDEFCQVADQQDWGRPQFWVAPPAQPSTAGAELRCREWLEGLMREGPSNKSKSHYRDEASAKFGVGTKAFARAWATAISNTGKTGWKKPGPKPKQ